MMPPTLGSLKREIMKNTPKIAIIGLGYVGLPVALAFGRKFKDTVGFDINKNRIEQLKKGIDITIESSKSELKTPYLSFTSDPSDLKNSNFYIVSVPTPIDSNRQPDLGILKSACKTIAAHLKKGDIVVFESTVYPGVTEEFCGPILARESGLEQGKDFKLGYSPERINPGDKEHTLERITKVVSGEDEEALKRVSDVYASIIDAGVFEAASIKVAEAAKVIENTQRDLNIALMNELALIFDKMNIRTVDVLEAAGTKWNFLKFNPGLVGGHCIGVDPYYLTAKAESLGYHPQVVLAGRRINDGMGAYIANKAIKLLIEADKSIRKSKAAVLGLTFKENVPDLRNSRVPDIIKELDDYGIDSKVYDAFADPKEAMEEYGIKLHNLDDLKQADLLILAVPHKDYVGESMYKLINSMPKNCVIIDVKSALDPNKISNKHRYWSL